MKMSAMKLHYRKVQGLVYDRSQGNSNRQTRLTAFDGGADRLNFLAGPVAKVARQANYHAEHNEQYNGDHFSHLTACRLVSGTEKGEHHQKKHMAHPDVGGFRETLNAL